MYLRHDLNFSQHVDAIVTTCSQKFYLLARCKKQGLGISSLDIVRAIVLNKISYTLSVYHGYLTEGQKGVLQLVLDRATSRGFTPSYYDLDVLAENAQYKLFRRSCQEGHCRNHLYTRKRWPPDTMQLRTRGHIFQLPTIKYEFNKRNFIVRSLFNYL